MEFLLAFDRSFCRLKTTRLVGSIAERANSRCAATAQGKRFFALQIEHIAGSIRDGNRPGDKQRSMIFHNNFDFRHFQIFQGLNKSHKQNQTNSLIGRSRLCTGFRQQKTESKVHEIH